MKVFIAASLILLLLIGSVIGNGIFLHDRLSKMIDAGLLLPESVFTNETEFDEAMTALGAVWDDVHPIAVITVSSARIEHIDRAIDNIKAGWEAEDDAAYRQARADLLLLLRRLRAMESCSFSAVI